MNYFLEEFEEIISLGEVAKYRVVFLYVKFTTVVLFWLKEDRNGDFLVTQSKQHALSIKTKVHFKKSFEVST